MRGISGGDEGEEAASYPRTGEGKLQNGVFHPHLLAQF